MANEQEMKFRVGMSGEELVSQGLKSIAGNFSDVMVKIGATTAILTGLTVAFKGLKSSISTASEFESLQMRLNNLYGSAEKGASEFEKFRKIATVTPFSLKEITEAGATLKAFGMDAENTLVAVSDLASYMGMNVVEASQAVGRAFAGGVGAADVLRERGVLNLIKSFKGIDDLTKLTLPQFRQALIDTMIDPAGGIAGAGKKMMDTYEGAISNLGDALDILKNQIGSAFLPLLEGMKRGLTDVVNAITGAGDDVKNTTKSAEEQRSKFEQLVYTYTRLHNQQNLTITDQQMYKETIKSLLELYPNYFSNIDLEKGKWTDISEAIDKARESLVNYLNYQIQESVMQKWTDKLTDVRDKIISTQTELDKLEGEFKAGLKSRTEEAYTLPTQTQPTGGITQVETTWAYEERKLTATLAKLREREKELQEKLNAEIETTKKLYGITPPTNETETKTGVGTGTGGAPTKELTERQKQLQQLLSQLDTYQKQKNALALEGEQRDLALLELQYQDEKAIILNGLTDETKITAEQKEQLRKLDEFYGYKREQITKEYTDKEIAEAENRKKQILSIQSSFAEQMRDIDWQYYYDYKLRMIDEEVEAFRDASIEEAEIVKWKQNQIARLDAEQADKAIAEQEKERMEWIKTHQIQMALMNSFTDAWDNAMTDILRITSDSNGWLTQIFINMANSFIQQVERMITQWLMFQVLVKGLGLNIPTLVNPFVAPASAVSPTLSNTGGTVSLSMDTGIINSTLSSQNRLVGKIDKLIDAIENNPPKIYTQLIKGVPLKNAVERAYREANAL